MERGESAVYEEKTKNEMNDEIKLAGLEAFGTEGAWETSDSQL